MSVVRIGDPVYPRGIHQLKGVPDQWAVYGVTEGA
jgi:hypothetical protein